MNKYVCIYKELPKESFYSEEDMYVALDSYSGGYPTRVNITRVHCFKTAKEAESYASHFPEIYAAEIKIDVTIVTLLNQSKAD